MRVRQQSNAEQITAALLVGTGVMLVTRLLVVGLMGLSEWLMGILVWSSHIPDELRFQPVWFMSLLSTPYYWVVYLVCGGIAGVTSWRYQTAVDQRQRKMVLRLCFAGLLILTGWFLMPTEAIMVLTGLRPMYPHGWRIILQGSPVMMVEPVLAGIALLKMPTWLRFLHQPVTDFLRGG